MSGTLYLDSGPLDLITQRREKSSRVDACRQWYEDLNVNGWTIYLPEIPDYEVRRELTRSRKTASVARLDLLAATAIYLPITTAAVRLASDLWAKARNSGWATADPQALDGDVILAAQALTLAPTPTSLVVATGNVAHLSRYLPAEEWSAIIP